MFSALAPVVASVLVVACGASAPAQAPVKGPPSRGEAPPPTRKLETPLAPPPLRLAAHPAVAADFVDPDRATKLAALIPKLEKIIDDRFAQDSPPSLAVAMIVDGPGDQRGKVVFRRVLGHRDALSKTPATERTLYRIGSITKTFTSAAMLSLRDAGVLRLDDPVDKFLPELARVEYPHADAPRITIRHLLTHTSGLPRVGSVDYTRPDRDVTEAEIFADLETMRLERAPGTRHSYSNLAVGLAGIVVGRAAKKPFRVVMKERITDPLGMTSTSFDPPRGAETATGYAKHTDTTKPASLWRLGAEEGAGGLWSSLDDMTKWIAFQLSAWPPRAGDDTGPLRRATVREAHIAGFPIALEASMESGTSASMGAGAGAGAGAGTGTAAPHITASAEAVGLGWHTSSTCAYERLVKHSGAIDGFNASVGMAPDRGFGFVVLASSIDTDAGAIRDALFDEVAASGALAARVPRPAPGFEELIRKLSAFRCDEAEHQSVFTPTFIKAVPIASYAPTCKKLSARHGACTVPPMTTLDDPMSGTIKIKCERGEMNGHVLAVETPDGIRLQGLRVRSSGFVAPKRLYESAIDVLRLETKFEAGRFEKIGFATGITAVSLEKGLAEIKKDHGTCRLAPGADKSLESDGAVGALFDLQCERGTPLQLEIGVDEAGKVDEARFKPKSSKSRCIDPPAPTPSKEPARK